MAACFLPVQPLNVKPSNAPQILGHVQALKPHCWRSTGLEVPGSLKCFNEISVLGPGEGEISSEQGDLEFLVEGGTGVWPGMTGRTLWG